MGKNLNNEKISLVWSYTPIDYFEEIFKVQKDEYELEFKGGNIKATLDTMFYQQNKGIIDKILSDIDTYFVGVQVVSHKAYKIEKHIMHSYNAKGGKGVTIFAPPIEVKLSASADIKITDSEGNVVTDTRAERIREQQELAELTNRYFKKDITARAIIESYQASVNDPSNELVYLYEIREALVKRFGDENNTKAILNINKLRLSRLRRLANDVPLRQGRHRGKNQGQLRNATTRELNEAREIAKGLILSYLKYLQNEESS